MSCVSDLCPVENFTDNGDGTVTQNTTGLVWQLNDNGIQRSWQGAMDYCSSNSAGLPGSGWRLPNKEELQSISRVDVVFIYNGSYYWSALSETFKTGLAWSVHFYYGNVYRDYKANSKYVRCVR